MAARRSTCRPKALRRFEGAQGSKALLCWAFVGAIAAVPSALWGAEPGRGALPVPAFGSAAATTPAAGKAPGSSAAANATTASTGQRWETGVTTEYRKWRGDEPERFDDTKDEERSAPLHPDLVRWRDKRSEIIQLREQRIVLRTEPSSFLQIDLAVEASRPSVRNEIEKETPKIEEEIDRICRSLDVDRLRTVEGKWTIKRRILRSINSTLESGAIGGVYYTKFVVLDASMM